MAETAPWPPMAVVLKIQFGEDIRRVRLDAADFPRASEALAAAYGAEFLEYDVLVKMQPTEPESPLDESSWRAALELAAGGTPAGKTPTVRLLLQPKLRIADQASASAEASNNELTAPSAPPPDQAECMEAEASTPHSALAGSVEVAAPSEPAPEVVEEAEVAEVAEVLAVVEAAEAAEALQAAEDADMTCSICFTARPDAIFMPCRHGGSCRECARRLANCPFCRASIQQVTNLDGDVFESSSYPNVSGMREDLRPPQVDESNPNPRGSQAGYSASHGHFHHHRHGDSQQGQWHSQHWRQRSGNGWQHAGTSWQQGARQQDSNSWHHDAGPWRSAAAAWQNHARHQANAAQDWATWAGEMARMGTQIAGQAVQQSFGAVSFAPGNVGHSFPTPFAPQERYGGGPAPQAWDDEMPVEANNIVTRNVCYNRERRRILRGMITGRLEIVDSRIILEDTMVTGSISLIGNSQLLLRRGMITGSVHTAPGSIFENRGGMVTGSITRHS